MANKGNNLKIVVLVATRFSVFPVSGRNSFRTTSAAIVVYPLPRHPNEFGGWYGKRAVSTLKPDRARPGSTLDPYLVQWEQAAAIKWLSEEEQNYTYFRFNRDALLRTDAKTRTETLEKRIFSGQLTPNEARQIEDMPAYSEGNNFYVPANMMPVNGGEENATTDTQSR